MTNRAAFTHKPKFLAKGAKSVFCSINHTKALWADIWAKAQAADWYEPGVGYVGNVNGKFYFQISGLSTGLAEVEADPELVAASLAKFG